MIKRIIISFVAAIVLLAIILSGLYLYMTWGNEEIGLKYISESIVIDGILNESCWELKKHDFFLYDRENPMTTDVPSLLFLRDENTLYFAFSYDMGSNLPIEIVNNQLLYLRLELRPKIEGSKYEFRSVFKPYDKWGNPKGIAYCDCGFYPKYFKKDMRNFIEYVSQIKDNIWNVEVAIPLREIISIEDKLLSLRIKFVNRYSTPEGERSYYPLPRFSRYRKYFVIMNGDSYQAINNINAKIGNIGAGFSIILNRAAVRVK